MAEVEDLERVRDEVLDPRPAPAGPIGQHDHCRGLGAVRLVIPLGKDRPKRRTVRGTRVRSCIATFDSLRRFSGGHTGKVRDCKT